MFNRWFYLGVGAFWLIAMSWLLSQKVLPPLMVGDPPDYQASLPEAGAEVPPPTCWRIEWDGRYIGTAASQAVSRDDGAELRSVIRFTKLPVKDMLRQLLGAMAPLISKSLGDEEFTPNMSVVTRLHFGEEKRLSDFQTVVDLPELPRFMFLDGRVDETGKLRLTATASYGSPIPGEPPPRVTYRHELDLPRDALVGDSLSPRSELTNLKVGQQWTIPTYRPFPPNAPVQILLAKVERKEFITWDNDLVETLVVVYHDEAGTGLGSARGPIGRTWVQPDGTVLRQEAMLSNMRITFERLPADAAFDTARLLDDEAFAAYFAE